MKLEIPDPDVGAKKSELSVQQVYIVHLVWKTPDRANRNAVVVLSGRHGHMHRFILFGRRNRRLLHCGAVFEHEHPVIVEFDQNHTTGTAAAETDLQFLAPPGSTPLFFMMSKEKVPSGFSLNRTLPL